MRFISLQSPSENHPQRSAGVQPDLWILPEGCVCISFVSFFSVLCCALTPHRILG
jgi:hypothetical protein